MNTKKLFALLLSALLAFSFVGCKDKKCNHRDADDDGICDKCSAPYTDGDDTGKNSSTDTSVTCTFTVQTDDRTFAAGVAFTLSSQANTYSLVSDENGQVTAKIEPAVYTVSYDYDTLPDACSPDVYSIDVKSATAITLLLIDNTPDGSEEKPFPLTEDEKITLAANAELYYTYRGSETVILQIESENVRIVYNGTTYEPVDGVVSVSLDHQNFSSITFSIKNVGTETVQAELKLTYPLGSRGNPILLSENATTANVPENGEVYYKWIAPQNGIVVVSSENTLNDISMLNTTTNAVSSATYGSACEYLVVSANDEIILSVSSLAQKGETLIEFSVAVYLGTEEDPVPFLKNNVNFSMEGNSSLVCLATAGKTLEINDGEVSVIFNGNTYTPDEFGVITFTLEGDGEVLFTVNNLSENKNGVEIKLK